MTPKPPIGLIAGSGQFPVLAARGARGQGHGVVIVGFEGYSDPGLARECDHFHMVKLGQIGKVIRFFKTHGACRVAFAGAVNKPRALSLRPDARAIKILFSLAHKGDDTLLRAVAAEFEREGLPVFQAAELVPQLRAPEGVLTARAPSDAERDDLRFGWNTAKAVGALDIGQCLVVKKGVVAAVEAIEGTDAAIARGGELAGAGCVVVKTVKPGQDERLDLPSVGLGTVRACVAARVTCLGIEAGKTLFFDPEASLREADAAGLAIVGLTQAP
ncbi:MAG: LpxI family protein [Desulfovibrionaceae bacterium]